MNNLQETEAQMLKHDEVKIYEATYRNYHQGLCDFLLKYTSNYNLIEDVVQDVFLSYWNNRNAITISSSLKNYLFKCAYNKFIDKQRVLKQNNQMLFDYNYMMLLENNNLESRIEEDQLKKLQVCINKLPKVCRHVFIERKIEGKNYNEISQKYNISLKTIESHINRAHKLLRCCMM